MKDKAVLLLTAAIYPSTPVTIDQPHLRLAQMLQSIRRWGRTGLVRAIVIADASGVNIDLSKVDADALGLPEGVLLEWIPMSLCTVAKDYGKGRAEAMLIEHAIRKSEILEGVAGFYKATSRLGVNNFSAIHAANPDGHDLICRPLDTRFYYVSKKFFLVKLAPLTLSIDDRCETTYVEYVYAPAFSQGLPFVAPPQYVGRDGTSGRTLHMDYEGLDADIASAKRILRSPDLMLYCCYHGDAIKHFQAQKWLSPDMEHVTFVKTVPHPYSFPAKHHLDLSQTPWALNLGTKWQEWDFIASLCMAACSGEVKLPQYVGFCHYDMDIARYDPTTPLTDESLVVLSNYTVDWAIRQNIRAYGKEVVEELFRLEGVRVTDELRQQLLPLCCAAIMPRNVFLSVMSKVAAAMLDRKHFINAHNQDDCPPDVRVSGGLSERYFAALLTARRMNIIHCPIDHWLVQSNGRHVPRVE